MKLFYALLFFVAIVAFSSGTLFADGPGGPGGPGAPGDEPDVTGLPSVTAFYTGSWHPNNEESLREAGRAIRLVAHDEAWDAFETVLCELYAEGKWAIPIMVHQKLTIRRSDADYDTQLIRYDYTIYYMVINFIPDEPEEKPFFKFTKDIVR